MSEPSFIPAERIERRILLIRGQKVMLDFELAELYGVEARALNQAVKRNRERFPDDFMFQLSDEEAQQVMRSQIVTLNEQSSRKSLAPKEISSSQTVATSSLNSSQIVMSSRKHRGLRYRPYEFTEQGVAMLSSVLRSSRAIQVNIAIMRTFVHLRQLLATHADLARKLRTLESKYDAQFKVVFDAIRELMDKEKTPRTEIGFHTLMNEPAPQKGKGKPKTRRP